MQNLNKEGDYKVEMLGKGIIEFYRKYNLYLKKKKFKRRIKEFEQAEKTDLTYGVNRKSRETQIIVSLTSYPSRLMNLHYTIKSIFVQTMKPDRVILFLDDDCIYEDIPEELKKLEKYGLEIYMRPGNLKPHKKYYYAIKENPGSVVITVDDDCIYSKNLVEELYNTYETFPTCVVAARSHKIRFDETGKIKKYFEWEWMYKEEYVPSMSLLATGVAGALYPPKCMDERYLFNTDLICSLSPTADDLWLKVMQVLKGTKVVLCDRSIEKDRINFDILLGNCTGTLQADNVHRNKNDIYMERLMAYFSLGQKNFKD